MEAVEKRQCGGSQSSLVRCNDGHLYNLKMNPSPQGPNVLANEALGSMLLRGLGFTVPQWRPIKINLGSVRFRDKLAMETPTGRSYPDFGVHFGSRFAGTRWDCLHHLQPEKNPTWLRNRDEFAGMILFDLWAGNQDVRQFVYRKVDNQDQFEACWIDNGHCFGGPNWDAPYGVWRNLRVLSVPILDQWLQYFESRLPGLLSIASKKVPPEWYEGDIAMLCSFYLKRLLTLREIYLDGKMLVPRP